MSAFLNKLCSFGKLAVGKPSDAEDGHIRRVAIIGAGPIGVSTAKFLEGEACFENIDVYEQQSSFGGAWIWSQPDEHDVASISVPQTDPRGRLDRIRFRSGNGRNAPEVTTPMYDNLETNIPNTMMRFSEKPFSKDTLLFPHRGTVLEYIDAYSQEVKHLVRFGHQVTSLKLENSSTGRDSWRLTSKDLRSGRETTQQYDAVAIANGHFSHVSIPDTPGITRWAAENPGSVRHSKFFRRPEDYAGKKVVVVGNASSGIDIGSQIAMHCQKPIVMSARSDPLFKMPAYAEHVNVPGLVEFVDPKLGNRAVKFADGTIEENVDIVLFCTGYFLSFPFLASEIQKEIINTGYMVHGTYQHIFWQAHPTLAFMGLPNKVLPLPLGEAQACALARVWSGRLTLPAKPVMQIWEHQRWRQIAEMLKMRGKPAEAFHVERNFLGMGPGQDTSYHNELIRWASEAQPGPGRPLPHAWDEREIWLRSQMAPMKKAWAELGTKKKEVFTVEQLGLDYEKFKAEQEEAKLADLAASKEEAITTSSA